MNDYELIKCCICLQVVENNLYQLCCNHIYHVDCIMKWLNEKEDLNFSCPLCRDNLKK